MPPWGTSPSTHCWWGWPVCGQPCNPDVILTGADRWVRHRLACASFQPSLPTRKLDLLPPCFHPSPALDCWTLPTPLLSRPPAAQQPPQQQMLSTLSASSAAGLSCAAASASPATSGAPKIPSPIQQVVGGWECAAEGRNSNGTGAVSGCGRQIEAGEVFVGTGPFVRLLMYAGRTHTGVTQVCVVTSLVG
jgi:hypothetical protein